MEEPNQNTDVQATATEPTPTEPQTVEPEHRDDAHDDGQLNEGGLKALRAERAARKAAEQAVKEQQKTFEERLAALEAENAQMKTEKFERRVVDAATGKLKTPSLALKLADVSDCMDDTQLATAIDKLIESCPELAAEPAAKSTEDPFRFANHVKSTPQNAHDMNALAFGNMVRTALNQ